MIAYSENIDEIKSLIKKTFEELEPYTSEKILKEKQSQLLAIEKTINDFNKSGLVVPDELRALKLNLSNEIDQRFEARKAFDELVIFLKGILLTKPQQKKIVKQRKHEVLNSPTGYKPERKQKTEFIHRLNKKSDNKNKTLWEASKNINFLKNLLAEGVIQPNAIIRGNYNNKQHTGLILADGRIKIAKNGHNIYCDTIHDAMVIVAPKHQNALEFWRIVNPRFKVFVRLSIYLKNKLK